MESLRLRCLYYAYDENRSQFDASPTTTQMISCRLRRVGVSHVPRLEIIIVIIIIILLLNLLGSDAVRYIFSIDIIK